MLILFWYSIDRWQIRLLRHSGEMFQIFSSLEDGRQICLRNCRTSDIVIVPIFVERLRECPLREAMSSLVVEKTFPEHT